MKPFVLCMEESVFVSAAGLHCDSFAEASNFCGSALGNAVPEELTLFVGDEAGFARRKPRVTGHNKPVEHVSSLSHKGFCVAAGNNDGRSL